MAVTADYQFDLAGFTFGLGTSTSVVTVSGLDMPEIDVSTQSAGNKHGAVSSGRYLKERTIALTGRINGTYSTMPVLRNALVRAFRPRPDDNDVALTFRWPGMGGNQVMYVKPQNLRGDFDATSTSVGYWDWMATLVAQDPRMYSEASKSQNYSVGNSFVLNNAGNFEAPATVTFNGPLTNPKISNSTTGTAFQLTMTIGSGQAVVVDTLNYTAYMASASQYSKIDPANKVFTELTPGNNTVVFTASSGTGSATVAWRDTSI